MKITVLRLGHRYVRDKRTTTHLILTARAFGAHEVVYSGQRDKKMETSIHDITKSWGGSFHVKYRKDGLTLLKECQEDRREVIHLTMYGLPIQNVIKTIRTSTTHKVIVVGGAKIPKIVYDLAHWNIAVTSQPHSEVSALCIFLHEFFEGKELLNSFENAELVIVPQKRGKKLLRLQLPPLD